MLSKRSKYALNALVYMAKEYGKGPIVIEKIATSAHVPKKFLESILLDLKNAGILQSKKGKGGGYYLNRKPNQIHMAEVMRLFDGAIALLPCATYKYYRRCEECRDERTCGIRDVVLEVRNRTVAMLKKATLAEMIRREARLARSGPK